MGGQQVPAMRGFHDRCTGVHWTQTNRALSPMAMFIEMMMYQMKTLIHPSVRRSMVKAKLVLDHMAAVREKVPATLMAGSSLP